MYLNLARKWRSKKFEEVIGQDFSVKLLKNCLYRNLIFPVYLLSGPKGCGKTTVARLFAAALNCSSLLKFRDNPKSISLPCLECQSCILFNKSSHPDFIEIDAASNTGVENVRQIIDSSSFIPALGSKKVYLIDEAHMLSKAAFNALLKTLEEPPETVMFILATTEVNKIIETVRSRCFQMFFAAIDNESLVNHIVHVCKSEKIEFDLEALNLIVYESFGSARDALNLLEKVWIGFDVINKDNVFSALGLMPEEHLIKLFEFIVLQKTEQVVEYYINLKIEKFEQLIIFKKLVNLIHSSILLKMNLTVNLSKETISVLKGFILQSDLQKFISMLDLCYKFEPTLLKTANPSILIQNLLIKLSKGYFKDDYEQETTIIKKVRAVEQKTSDFAKASAYAKATADKSSDFSESVKQQNTSSANNIPKDNEWHLFVKELEKSNDPLVLSIFKQGNYKKVENKITVSFNKDLIFFKDWIDNTTNVWRPCLNKFFGEIPINFVFTDEVAYIQPKSITDNNGKREPILQQKSEINNKTIIKKDFLAKENASLNLDLNKFQKVQMISKIFPGKVTSSSVIENDLGDRNE